MEDIAVKDEELVHIADIGAGTTSAAQVRLLRGPGGELRAEIEGDRCLLRGKAVWAFPLSLKRYVSILDSKDKEFCLIEDPDELDEESRSILFAWRTSFWTVETDHGIREFVMRWELDSVLLPAEHEILIIDIDGNRFHIPDYRALDENSRRIFDMLL